MSLPSTERDTSRTDDEERVATEPQSKRIRPPATGGRNYKPKEARKYGGPKQICNWFRFDNFIFQKLSFSYILSLLNVLLIIESRKL